MGFTGNTVVCLDACASMSVLDMQAGNGFQAGKFPETTGKGA